MHKRVKHVLVVGVGLVTLTPTFLPAAEPCDGFTWNVARERSLFAGSPQQLAAGKDSVSAPQISLGRLYQIALAPESDVHVATTPGHKPRGEGALAGVARLRISQAGVYRVSLSEGAWIDLVHEGTVIASEDHQGRAGCSAPHKVVQFRLPAGEVLVQLSGATVPSVQMTVTPAPQSSSAPAK